MEKSLLPLQTPSTPVLNLLTFIITGLGGVGKTEVARDFAIKNQNQFDAIIFIVADQRDRLVQSYAEVALSLGLVEPRSTPDPDNDREKLKLWFENPVKTPNGGMDLPNRLSGDNEGRAKWLLIFDNADNPQVLSDFWPIAGFGSVLVTSRDPSTKIQHYPFSDGLALEGLPTQDAMTLLKALTHNSNGGDESDIAAKAIVQRLEGLPLAIDQIASIITRRSLSLSDFVRDYVQASAYHKLYDERHTRNGYERSLGSVWAFDSLEAENKAAFSLLSVLAMLDPACIQEEVMLKSLDSRSTNEYPRLKTDYNDVLAVLIERSMIRRNRENGSLHIHRLVQDVARARMAKRRDTFTTAFTIAWKSVSACFPNRDEDMNTAGSVGRWQRCSVIYTHVVQLSKVTRELQEIQPDFGFPLEYVDLLYEAAWYVEESRETGLN